MHIRALDLRNTNASIGSGGNGSEALRIPLAIAEYWFVYWCCRMNVYVDAKYGNKKEWNTSTNNVLHECMEPLFVTIVCNLPQTTWCSPFASCIFADTLSHVGVQYLLWTASIDLTDRWTNVYRELGLLRIPQFFGKCMSKGNVCFTNTQIISEHKPRWPINRIS